MIFTASRSFPGRPRRIQGPLRQCHATKPAASPVGIFDGWAEQQAGPILALHGEIDAGNRDGLARAAVSFAQRCITQRHIAERHGGSGASAVDCGEAVIDAGELRFIDGGSLGVLETLHRTLADAGIRLRTRRAGPGLRRVSSICGLDDVLGFDPMPAGRPG